MSIQTFSTLSTFCLSQSPIGEYGYGRIKRDTKIHSKHLYFIDLIKYVTFDLRNPKEDLRT